MTETSPLVTIMVKGSGKYESVGGPIPNTEMKVVHSETRSSLAARQTGEICMRGPQVRERERERESALSDIAVCILIFGVVILCGNCVCHFLSAHSPH
jgi:acyl-CoA synthetase (AMP-forming)/AMP-acid ligase II